MATESLQAPLFFAHSLSSAHRGLEGRMKCATFTYNAHFQTYQKDTFALVCTPFCALASSTPHGGSLPEPPVNYPEGSQKKNCTPKKNKKQTNKQTNKQKKRTAK